MRATQSHARSAPTSWSILCNFPLQLPPIPLCLYLSACSQGLLPCDSTHNLGSDFFEISKVWGKGTEGFQTPATTHASPTVTIISFAHSTALRLLIPDIWMPKLTDASYIQPYSSPEWNWKHSSKKKKEQNPDVPGQELRMFFTACLRLLQRDNL